jgi:hypothetical protein
MSSAAVHPLPLQATYTDEPIFRLTVEQYHELIRSGKLTENDPVELLEGILVFKTPKKSAHATSTGLVRREIESLLASGWHYRSPEPITLEDGEPEPDGAVVRGRIEDYAAAHPTPADVAMVIEVADSSLERDRGIKLRGYARAGIAIYWIVNLVDRQVEVYSDPDVAAQPWPNYRKREAFVAGNEVPVRMSGALLGPISVVSLLPPK